MTIITISMLGNYQNILKIFNVIIPKLVITVERFDNETIERIQVQAEQIFKIMGHRDFARFDGWLLNDGRIWFSDFNTISGMEQNSFLFQQTSRIGFSHRDLL